jgi:hypothetical protein
MRTFFALMAAAVLVMSSLPASAKTTHMGLAPGAHRGDFMVQYVSLIPFAPKAQRATMLWVDADQRVPMRQSLGLPIDVRIHPTDRKGIYAVQILRENGTEITEKLMGFMPNDPSATSTFVDQRIQVHFADWKKLLAQPFPKSFAEN